MSLVALELQILIGSGLAMEDLLHFVKDLLELEEEKKRAKDSNKKMINSLSPKMDTTLKTEESSKKSCMYN